MTDERLESEIVRLSRAVAWIARLGEYTGLAGASDVHGRALDRAGYLILECLSDAGVVTMSELATRLDLHLSGVSREVSKLVDARLVTRSRSPDNHRLALIELTESGRASLEALRRVRVASHRQVLADWETSEIATLAELMTRYVDAVTASYLETPRTTRVRHAGKPDTAT